MKKALLLLIAVVTLTACGPRWYYPNLDWLIPWYVDDYISLDSRQSTDLGRRLVSLLDWHCRTQLPDYAGFLREIRRDAAEGRLDIQRFSAYNERIRGYWDIMIARIGPEVVTLMVTASDEQIRELFDNLERENQKLEEEFVNPPDEEIVRNRQKRMEKRLGYWFSDLTDAQQRMVAAWSEQLAPISADWIENRRKVQAEFQRLLEKRNHSEEFADAFLALLNHPEAVRSETYRAKIATNTERTLLLLAQVSASMTPDQHAHFDGRLESLANDFETLSCDPTQQS
ncbi:MAG TPA: DUF6279 family lipoprotein [Desulfobacterales bacterium]